MEDRKRQILDTAEELMGKYGAHKTNVIDVGKALGISHAAIYKYFPTKAALQEAIAERWLQRISDPLAVIAADNAPAEARLRLWMQTLHKLKRKKVLSDPELFASYSELAQASKAAVQRHMAELHHQVAQILKDLPVGNPTQTAQSILAACATFHHPYFVQQNAGSNSQTKELNALLDILLAGLKG